MQFNEIEPPSHLRGIVHRFLELNTDGALPDDYRFHALPDACTYIVFEQLETKIAGVCKLQASSEELNLGKMFHYVNIRFLPGVWQGDRSQVTHGMIDTPYLGDLPLIDINQRLSKQGLVNKQLVLSEFVESLVDSKLVVANLVTEKIFENLEDIHSVADMAAVCEMSTRQLQRTLKRSTGFAPHDFLKVLRLQQTLSGKDSSSYADQSHFMKLYWEASWKKSLTQQVNHK